MRNPSSISVIFIAISVIFVAIAFRDYLKDEDELTIVRKIWLRMAFIFTAVGIGLFFIQIFFF